MATSARQISKDGKTELLTLQYAPRKAMEAYHNRTQRWSCIVAHRRYGKTVAQIVELIKGANACKLPEPRFAYVAPTFAQAKDVVWGYLKHYGLQIRGAKEHESELRVDFPNGGRVRLYGSDNYDRMRGIYLDGLVNDEFGDQDPRGWTEVQRPALSDRKGWATFIGTPRGQNHFADIWEAAQGDPEWYTAMLKASQTGILDEEELSSARRMMLPEQYNAEYECSFYGSVRGAYYGDDFVKLDEQGALGNHGWNPAHAVHTAWDTGGTTSAWFFQLIDSEVRFIDYLEAVNKSTDYYASELRSKPYTYRTPLAGSDADDPKEIVGKSWIQSFADLGIHGFKALPKQRSINDGINQARLMLPRCKFFMPVVNDGVSALRNYRREWDEGRKVFRDIPRHDWASHPADAFRHAALGLSLIEQQSGISDWSKPLTYRNKFVI